MSGDGRADPLADLSKSALRIQMSESSPEPNWAVPKGRVFAVALIMAPTAFGVFAFYAAQTIVPPPGDGIICWVGAFFAILAFGACIVIPRIAARLFGRSILDRGPNGAQFLFLGKLLIAWSILVFSAFFNLIAYIVDQAWWSLAIAGVSMVWIALTFPTRSRFERSVAAVLQR